MKSAVDFETQKLNANLTANSVINIQRNASIQSRLESIDNNREVSVKSTLEVDGKQMVALLKTVPGIGDITAYVWLATVI